MSTLQYRMQMRVPPQVAFAAICDFDHITEWIPDIEKSYISSSGKVGVGTTFVEEGKFLGRPTQIIGIVREYEPNRKLVYEYETGPVAGIWEYNFRSYEGRQHTTRLPPEYATYGFVQVDLSADTTHVTRHDLQEPGNLQDVG